MIVIFSVCCGYDIIYFVVILNRGIAGHMVTGILSWYAHLFTFVWDRGGEPGCRIFCCALVFFDHYDYFDYEVAHIIMSWSFFFNKKLNLFVEICMSFLFFEVAILSILSFVCEALNRCMWFLYCKALTAATLVWKVQYELIINTNSRWLFSAVEMKRKNEMKKMSVKIAIVDFTCCCDCIVKWFASIKSQEFYLSNYVGNDYRLKHSKHVDGWADQLIQQPSAAPLESWKVKCML